METNENIPTCPGCHFGCALVAYRCGRGQGFNRMWHEGKEIPERRARFAPQLNDSESEAAMPPNPSRVMRVVGILGRKAQVCSNDAPDRKVLMAIVRQGGFFAMEKLAERAMIAEADCPGAVASLVDAGFAVKDREEVAGAVLRATPEGREKQLEWVAQREERIAKFFSPLSEEELTTLDSLARKLIG